MVVIHISPLCSFNELHIYSHETPLTVQRLGEKRFDYNE